jgi:hypothetical protein
MKHSLRNRLCNDLVLVPFLRWKNEAALAPEHVSKYYRPILPYHSEIFSMLPKVTLDVGLGGTWLLKLLHHTLLPISIQPSR